MGLKPGQQGGSHSRTPSPGAKPGTAGAVSVLLASAAAFDALGSCPGWACPAPAQTHCMFFSSQQRVFTAFLTQEQRAGLVG